MATAEYSLEIQVATFLTDLAHANYSPQMRRAFASDLAQLCAFHQAPLQTITTEVLRKFFEMHAHLRPATRARKQAAIARFLARAEQQELLAVNPMRKIDRVKLDPPQPRGVERSQIERIFKVIPASHLRDRLFYRLLAETGLRVSEGLSLYVEDLDLSLDNEHLTAMGKGGKRRTILLDDPRLVQQLRAYLKRMGYKHGLLFRAEKNGRGGTLRYQSMQERWDHYCSQAGVSCTLHQLRHWIGASRLENSMVDCPRIVLTGGPGGGKTTLMSELRVQDPQAKYWLLVPEAAPLLFQAGLDGSDKRFQRSVVHLQMALEESCGGVARPGQVLLCHRGTLDPLAYWLRSGWKEADFFALTGMGWEEHFRRYRGVIHLQTSAIGAQASYRRWPDAHRPETIEQATETDELCAYAWHNHSRYTLIENAGRNWLEKAMLAHSILSYLVSFVDTSHL